MYCKAVISLMYYDTHTHTHTLFTIENNTARRDNLLLSITSPRLMCALSTAIYLHCKKLVMLDPFWFKADLGTCETGSVSYEPDLDTGGADLGTYEADLGTPEADSVYYARGRKIWTLSRRNPLGVEDKQMIEGPRRALKWCQSAQMTSQTSKKNLEATVVHSPRVT